MDMIDKKIYELGHGYFRLPGVLGYTPDHDGAVYSGIL